MKQLLISAEVLCAEDTDPGEVFGAREAIEQSLGMIVGVVPFVVEVNVKVYDEDGTEVSPSRVSE